MWRAGGRPRNDDGGRRRLGGGRVHGGAGARRPRGPAPAAGRVRGPVSLRRGLPGEAYQGIRKDSVHLEGRPVLADEDGPFGNPTSDSLRTAMTPATRSLVMVIFAPAAYVRDRLEAHVAE